MVADTVKAFGGLDILVANAGINIRKPPQDYSSAEWHQIVDTNLNSVFDCCQAAYPEMKRRGGGKIVTIGSMTSIFGFGVGPVYAATKGAVVQLTQEPRHRPGRRTTSRSTASCPAGSTRTHRGAPGRSAGPERAHAAGHACRPLGRAGDLAGTAVFFCSRASDFVTGTALPVDGGYSSSIF